MRRRNASVAVVTVGANSRAGIYGENNITKRRMKQATTAPCSTETPLLVALARQVSGPALTGTIRPGRISGIVLGGSGVRPQGHTQERAYRSFWIVTMTASGLSVRYCAFAGVEHSPKAGNARRLSPQFKLGYA